MGSLAETQAKIFLLNWVPEVVVVEGLQSPEPQLVEDPLRLRRRQRREVVPAPAGRGPDRRQQRLLHQGSPDSAASGLLFNCVVTTRSKARATVYMNQVLQNYSSLCAEFMASNQTATKPDVVKIRSMY